MKKAVPSIIDRRITGVTITVRRHGTEVPKQATKAAREALKPMKLDPVWIVRGRGKAIAVTPMHLKAMNTGSAARRQPAVGRRRGTQELPELARLRDRALVTVAFGIAGRSEEVSSLDTEGITQVAEGLEVYVPSVKGRPPSRCRGRLRRETRNPPGPLLARLEGSRRLHRGPGLPARRPEGPPRHPAAGVRRLPSRHHPGRRARGPGREAHRALRTPRPRARKVQPASRQVSALRVPRPSMTFGLVARAAMLCGSMWEYCAHSVRCSSRSVS